MWRDITLRRSFWKIVCERNGIDWTSIPNYIKEHERSWIIFNAACKSRIFDRNFVLNHSGHRKYINLRFVWCLLQPISGIPSEFFLKRKFYFWNIYKRFLVLPYRLWIINDSKSMQFWDVKCMVDSRIYHLNGGPTSQMCILFELLVIQCLQGNTEKRTSFIDVHFLF